MKKIVAFIALILLIIGIISCSPIQEELTNGKGMDSSIANEEESIGYPFQAEVFSTNEVCAEI